MDNREKFLIARKRVEAKIGFMVHAAVYVGVNALLAVINLATDPTNIWFVWPLVGWGIALIGHGALVYVPSSPKKGSFKERMIRAEMKRLENS